MGFSILKTPTKKGVEYWTEVVGRSKSLSGYPIYSQAKMAFGGTTLCSGF
jgi:hypothetical protein